MDNNCGLTLEDLKYFDYNSINIGKRSKEEEKREPINLYKYTFLRHAESKFNLLGPIVGRDPILTDYGKEQAKNIKGQYDYALVSFMKRTIETFKLSNIKVDHIEYSSLCREQRDRKSNWLHDEKAVNESNDEFDFRINLLKQYIQNLGQLYDKIIIITHHGVIEAITGKRLGNAESIGINTII